MKSELTIESPLYRKLCLNASLTQSVCVCMLAHTHHNLGVVARLLQSGWFTGELVQGHGGDDTVCLSYLHLEVFLSQCMVQMVSLQHTVNILITALPGSMHSLNDPRITYSKHANYCSSLVSAWSKRKKKIIDHLM